MALIIGIPCCVHLVTKTAKLLRDDDDNYDDDQIITKMTFSPLF